jgi:hypothetical protein
LLVLPPDLLRQQDSTMKVVHASVLLFGATLLLLAATGVSSAGKFLASCTRPARAHTLLLYLV